MYNKKCDVFIGGGELFLALIIWLCKYAKCCLPNVVPEEHNIGIRYGIRYEINWC